MNSLDMKKAYGDKTEKIAENKDFHLFEIKQESGSGTIKRFSLFEGVELCIMDLHVEEIDYAESNHNFSSDFFSINHCFKGLFEATFQDGQCVYLGENDSSINLPEKSPIAHAFPLGRYFGAMIVVDIKAVKGSIEQFISINEEIDLLKIYEKIKASNEFQVFRQVRSISEIFTCMYQEENIFYLRIKFLELLYHLSNQQTLQVKSCKYYERGQVKKVKEIKHFLTNNLGKRYKVEELSIIFKISQTSLKECFKEIYGSPISIFMREYRVSYAEKLLRETTVTIADIAEQVGYENQSKFTETFKKHTGMLPVEYRNQKFD